MSNKISKKDLTQRIEELIRYYASDQFGDTPLIGEILIPPETIPALEAGIKRLISEVIREVIGEDESTEIKEWPMKGGILVEYPPKDVEGRNKLRAEQRQRAKKLGIKI